MLLRRQCLFRSLGLLNLHQNNTIYLPLITLFAFPKYYESTEKPRERKSPFIAKNNLNKYKKLKFHAIDHESEAIESIMESEIEQKSDKAQEKKQAPESDKKEKTSVFSPGVAAVKSTNIRTKEILGIQNLNSLVAFLNKPSNFALSLAERNIIHDKLIKIILNMKKVEWDAIREPLKDFFDKYLIALRASGDQKTYIGLFLISMPMTLLNNFESFYVDCLGDLLFNFPKLKYQDLLPILFNFNKIYYKAIEKEQTEKQVQRILEIFENSMDQVNIQTKLKIINLMRVARISNNRIADFMLYYAEMNFYNLNYEDLLIIVTGSLRSNSIIPYELIYKLRNRFNQIYHQLEPGVIIKTLANFTRIKMTFDELFYENIFKILGKKEVLENLDVGMCVIILNNYSKLKHRDQEFFERYFDKILKYVAELDKDYLRILLLSLVELNYKNYEAYKTLYNQFNNIITIIRQIQKEEELSDFEIQYFNEICNYISSEIIGTPLDQPAAPVDEPATQPIEVTKC